MASASSPSITTTTRTERSLFSRALQTCIRPFRPRLVTPGKEFPAGSPKLTPDSSARKRCTVEERKVDDIWVYDLRSARPPLAATKHIAPERQSRIHRIYYFAGGGYSQPASSQHWKFCAAIATTLPNTIVTVVSYPIAPNSPAPRAIPQLLRLYSTLLTQSRDAKELVTVAGDSSGANIAFALVLETLKEGGEAPDAMLGTCPAADGSKTNPAIDRLDKIDPLLTAAFTKQVADKWRAEWEGVDPRVSPNHGDLSLLKKYDVEVIGITAGNDVLSADAIVFRDLLVKHGVRGSWLHWEGQMHCFPLAFGYRLSEAQQGFQWIVDALANVRDHAQEEVA